jgi:1-acyl-sn-glycerol-3-phosphate acyltransferase
MRSVIVARRWITAIYTRFIKAVVWMISAIVGWVRVSGLENLPDSGPYIIVTNHLSVIDVAVVLLAFPTQQMRVFAADKWRRNPVTGLLLGLSGAIWIRRGEVDRKALRVASDALRNGEILGMAPEGTRSKDGVMHKARQGPAYLASRTGVPLVPVGIINSDTFAANIRRLRRTDLQARIGPPFTLPEPEGRPRSRELEAYSELIMVHIAHLLPQRYHGYYAYSPGLAAIKVGKDPWQAIIQNERFGRSGL